jgi:hypothetical protein
MAEKSGDTLQRSVVIMHVSGAGVAEQMRMPLRRIQASSPAGDLSGQREGVIQILSGFTTSQPGDLLVDASQLGIPRPLSSGNDCMFRPRDFS